MNYLQLFSFTTVLLTLQTPLNATAFATEPKRTLEIRHFDWEGENHLRLSVAASEVDGTSAKYPIKTLDSSSFQIRINGSAISEKSLAVTTFDATRRLNSRALVWVYDATAVKTIRGLTGSLRTLAAQSFPEFQADYLAMIGVAGGKSIERANSDPSQPNPPLSIQRLLTGQLVNLKSESVSTAHPLCAAANKFKQWEKRGLKRGDQNALILMGGAGAVPPQERLKVAECERTLDSMHVRIHQIVFAKPETFLDRQWVPERKNSASESNFRVIELAGASRALQAVRSSLDSEYQLNFQVPDDLSASENEMNIIATYHEKTFQSETVKLSPRPNSDKANPNVSMAVRQPEAQTPQRFIVLNHAESLAYEAWLEWLATAVMIGFTATFLHIRRMHGGHITISELSEGNEGGGGPVLVVLTGRHKGREYRINRSSTWIGCGWNCDIRLMTREMKRRHGRLEIQGDKAILHDFSGGNISVNGRALHAIRALGHGSVIRIGELQLLFQCGES